MLNAISTTYWTRKPKYPLNKMAPRLCVALCLALNCKLHNYFYTEEGANFACIVNMAPNPFSCQLQRENCLNCYEMTMKILRLTYSGNVRVFKMLSSVAFCALLVRPPFLLACGEIEFLHPIACEKHFQRSEFRRKRFLVWAYTLLSATKLKCNNLQLNYYWFLGFLSIISQYWVTWL